MKKPFRIAALAALAVAAVAPSIALAQAFPSKPIRLICPFPPAGAVDIASRAIANELQKNLGQPVTVENRPGAGGNLGGEMAAKAPADGYTLFMTTSGIQAINPALYSKMSYDPNKDLVPVAPLVSLNNVLVLHPSVPGHVGARRDRGGQGESGQDHLCLVRQRDFDPHVGRAVQAPYRREHAAHPLQGQRSRGRRPDRRAGEHDVRQHPVFAAAHQGRQAQGPGHHGRQARPGPARPAHHRRSRRGRGTNRACGSASPSRPPRRRTSSRSSTPRRCAGPRPPSS